MATTHAGARGRVGHQDPGTGSRTTGSGHGAKFARALDARSLTLLTLGGIMGSGLFLASGMAIHLAGPSIVVVFLVGFVAMALEITALAEMSAADPTPGSFLVYCQRVLGPGFTFVTGWIYWFSSVLTMSSEVTAAALFTRTWVPATPLWLWSLAYSALIVGLNFVSVRGFGQVEAVLAGVKVLAVLLFLAAGTAALAGWLPAQPARGLATWSQALAQGGWLPHGAQGAAAALLLVLFAYAGTGVIGMAAAETAHPARTIRQALRATIAWVAVLYLGSAVFLVTLVPWTSAPTHSSPFVHAVATLGIPFAAALLNLVLLTAVLSTMNAALYANVRVLYSLAHEGQAPRALGRLNHRGLPVAATWTSAGLLLGAIALAYLLPHRAYAYLVTATGFQAMFIWLIVLLTHLRYRPYLLRHRAQALHFRLPGYPLTTLLPMAIVLIGLAAALREPSEAVGAGVGFGGIVAATVLWFGLRHRLQSPAGPRA
jgi:L-asparagine transporter-like permease